MSLLALYMLSMLHQNMHHLHTYVSTPQIPILAISSLSKKFSFYSMHLQHCLTYHSYDQHKCISLQQLNPSHMSLIQLYVNVQILQSLMIYIQYKILRKQVISPLLQVLNYGIRFMIINWVSTSSIMQLLTEISYRSSFLTQYWSNYIFDVGSSNNVGKSCITQK